MLRDAVEDDISGILAIYNHAVLNSTAIWNDTPADLAAALWDLPGWAKAGRRLLREMDRAKDIPEQFAVAAAMVRHLLTDPVLPAALLPDDWPADRLRDAYADFAATLVARRHDQRLLEVP